MKTPIILMLLAVAACGQKPSSSTKRTQLKQSGNVSLIMTGVENVAEFKSLAFKQGILVEGDQILFLTGDADSINNLNIPAGDDFNYHLDEPLKMVKAHSFTPDNNALYMAKKDFGLLEFWKTNPEADGRGVTVGILDDGISPHQHGFITTSTGERKFLAKGSQSTFTTYDLKETEGGFVAEINEEVDSFDSDLDLNADGTYTAWKVQVPKTLDKVCIDINQNDLIDADECKGSFAKTGEYFLAKDARFAIMVELDAENKKVKVFQPEKGEDSHGEGVASVLAGYNIGNLKGFNGVAPGSQIVDYDLSELTNTATEYEYTISTFLKGLDWLGSHGAEVVNISYSLGFTSVETQTFMRGALESVIKKHNMVVSFSAGNNGPGLGSLNRRSIYPDSSLVTGAFISKELDEKVWGVTGVPEEGRVAFYSSRGPGQGIGPTLISPLSSLTNSTPDEGHMAFNGTSSAAPALAGLAAVLISSIKQQGLKVDAPSVVHALRLSGKRLKAEPFVFQGNGLPQAEAALAIYKKLIKGEIFQNVEVENSKESLDGIPSKGIFLRASQVKDIETRTIYLRGITSALAGSTEKVNLLVPVRLEYSAGISGPRELWVSSSENSFHIDISIKDVLAESTLEAFGEIKLISQNDGSVIATVPVTVVNDVNVLTRPEATFKLGAQEGKRFHLHIPEGTKAFKVNAEVLDGESRMISLSVFDTNQVRMVQKRISSDLWIPVNRHGYYQIGLSMNGGTPRGAVVKIEIETINLKIKSTSVNAATANIKVQNLSRSSIHGKLIANQIHQPFKSILFDSTFARPIDINETLSEGNYKIELKPTQAYDLSYMYNSCSIKQTKPDGSVVLSSEKSFSVSETSKVEIRCVPFELGITNVKTVEWVAQLSKGSTPLEAQLDMAPGSMKEIKIEGLKPGKYNIEVKDSLSESTISLGEIEVI